LLSPEAFLFSAPNTSNVVCRPGSTWTRGERLKCSVDSLAGPRELVGIKKGGEKEEREKKEREGRK